MNGLEQLAKPRITPTGVALAVVCWGIYTFLYSLSIVAANDVQFWGVFVGQIIGNAMLLILTLPAWWYIFRALHQSRWWLRVALHLAYAPLFGWLGVEGFLLYCYWFVPHPEVAAHVESVYPFIIGTNITLYIVHFSVLHAVRAIARLGHQQRRAAELQLLAHQSELSALRAQINPHFLFNTLNSISALAGDNPEATRNMISRLAEMMRYAIDSSKRDLVTLREEIEFTKAYLSIECQRMSDRMTVEWDIDRDVMDELLPPIVIQPLVENAIKHGIAPRESGGALRITIRRNVDVIDIAVEDNGIGAPQDLETTSKNGIGLANTRARLEKHYGSRVFFETQPLSPHGFSAAFRIPC